MIFKIRNFLFMFVISNLSIHSYCLQLETSYEPFLLKQYGRESVRTYQAGTLTSSDVGYQSRDLMFHLVSLRIKKTWPVLQKNFSFSMETGLSASPFPVVKRWDVPAADSTFTGTIATPVNATNFDYWDGHSIVDAFNNQKRYLIEETSLRYIPLKFGINKSFIFNKLNVEVGLEAGFNIFYLTVVRESLSGSPGATFSTFERSKTHFAETAGVEFGLDYAFSDRTLVFFLTDLNGVQGISDFETDTFGQAIGYRFDGLRYNYKLGVQWKI